MDTYFLPYTLIILYVIGLYLSTEVKPDSAKGPVVMCCLQTIRISMFKFWHNTDGRDKALQLFIVYYQVFLLELMVDRNWYRRPELGHLSVVHVLYVASLKWTRPALPWPLLNLYKHEQLLEFWVVICLNTTVHGCFTFSCCFILNTLHLSTVPNYLPIENASAWSRQAGILCKTLYVP